MDRVEKKKKEKNESIFFFFKSDFRTAENFPLSNGHFIESYPDMETKTN